MGGPTTIGSPETIYMCSKEMDGNLVSRKIEMNVCGNEEIELKSDSQSFLLKTVNQNSGVKIDGLPDTY